ncbi:MAG: hypothetical protein SVR04_10030 [Spirochaetota bacterium]|nr:hypothetical protein [Spirochaetota bacterium]
MNGVSIKERLRAFMDRLPDGLSEDVKSWAIHQFVVEKKDWSPALTKAVSEGEYRAARARLRPVAQNIIQAAIGGEGV